MPIRRSVEFWAGVRATIPLVIGALVVANGLTPLGVGAMSALVYAGAAQFLAAGLVASGAGVGVIVFTTFVVNLRHTLYAVSLAPQPHHSASRYCRRAEVYPAGSVDGYHCAGGISTQWTVGG